GSTLTVGAGITLRGTRGLITSFSDDLQPVKVVNQGTLSADVTGGSITLDSSITWTNSGAVQALNGATFSAQGPVTNFSGGTLTGGTWQVYANSTLRQINSGVITNAANILLNGLNSNFYAGN